MEPSLYIHIPFCRRKCIYCNFYSCIYDASTAASLVDILIGQLKELSARVYSIYVGGGTPSVLDIRMLGRLLSGLKKFSITSGEFTVEANPESLDDDRIKLFLDSGVNRLSIGLQSFNERKLKKLGRIHTAAKGAGAVELAHKRGFKDISVDLIFGVWDEKAESWKDELDQAARLPITHVSCYELTYEKDTPLFAAAANKSVMPLSDEINAAMYGAAIDLLSLRGFKQYEVSNFAKGGYESKHNRNYWDNNSYIGLGPSAVSYLDGERSRNVSDIKEYAERSGAGKPLAESSERLSPIRSAKETAAVKIRTKDGIDFDWFDRRTGFDFLKLENKALPKLLEEGLIKYKKYNNISAGVCLKRKGFLFCDTVSSALL
ncbi:MAG: radical SAM family heme chaperone HemW [Candidatus Omnitrophota bacterium]